MIWPDALGSFELRCAASKVKAESCNCCAPNALERVQFFLSKYWGQCWYDLMHLDCSVPCQNRTSGPEFPHCGEAIVWIAAAAIDVERSLDRGLAIAGNSSMAASWSRWESGGWTCRIVHQREVQLLSADHLESHSCSNIFLSLSFSHILALLLFLYWGFF